MLSLVRQWTAIALLSLAVAPALIMANTETVVFHWAPSVGPLDDLPARIQPRPSTILRTNSEERLSLSLSAAESKKPTEYLVELVNDYEPERFAARAVAAVERGLRVHGVRTVRLSWPASHPTDFRLDLYSIPASASRSTQDYAIYLLISATPSFVSSRASAAGSSASVPFTVLFEPVHLGFIPHSTVPLIAGLAGLLLALWAGKVPQRATRALEGLARSKEDKNKKE
ncbi:hypothetical protein JCM1841_001606 [Sporobolomyces salmonicolor]